MIDRQAEIERRRRVRFRFRNYIGIPVSSVIFVECHPDGGFRIVGSVEVERSSGNRIVSDGPVSEDEVLMMYLDWRRRPENQERRILIETQFKMESPVEKPLPIQAVIRPRIEQTGLLFSEAEIAGLPF